MTRRVPACAGLAAALAGLALVAGAARADVEVTGAWSRALPPVVETGAAYLTVVNDGDADDRIVGASSPIAEAVEVHESKMDGGVMRMREVESVPVPAGGRAVFEPDGLHLMLVGLREPLVEGERFALMLELEHGGPVAATVEVRAAGARGPGGEQAHHHGDGDHAPAHAAHHADGDHHGHGPPREMPAAVAPSVKLFVEADPVGGWNVHLATERFRFAPEHVNDAHVPGEGHAHLYLDGRKIARVYGPWHHVDRLPRGEHVLRATLNANGHAHYAVDGVPVADEVVLTVPGPATTSAPKASRVFVLRLDGGDVAGIDGDTVRVSTGDVVEMHWSAGVPTELALEHYGATASPTATSPSTMRFRAETPGRFAIRRADGGEPVLWVEVAG